MHAEREKRHLTTILVADVVGYSSLMAADEAGTFARVKADIKELFEPHAAEYRGHVVKLLGDGVLMEFESVVDAVRFAVNLQRANAQRNLGVPEKRRLHYRIGINVGDVIVDGEDIYGDGVNVAARLQELAEPGTAYVSGYVYGQIEGKVEAAFEDLGEKRLKNIPNAVRVYRIVDTSANATAPRRRPSRRAWWLLGAGAAMLLAIVAGLAWWRPWLPAGERAAVARMAHPLPERPSLAVLPFDNLTGDAAEHLWVNDRGLFALGSAQ